MSYEVKTGLRENIGQFSLLVLINAFVGGMAGMERSILPRIASEEFHIAAKTAILSFIVVFGITKAIANYFSGQLANKIGRKNLLTLGWLFGLPVPFILMYATNWNMILAANVLLGINQGLAWSSTVVMKIDLAGDKQRGLAMGLNEFAGYLSVALVAFFTGWVAATYGLRPYPFYIGIVLSVLGLLGTVLLVKDTKHHVMSEATASKVPRLGNTFRDTTWRHRNLSSVTQAGLINNLNDGMAWGVLPILLAAKGFSIAHIGIVTAIYPAVWGIGQLFTGKMSDIFCKKDMLFLGMGLQGVTLIMLVFAHSLLQYSLLSVALGFGTAMVYPTFLATIAENTHPADRAGSLGVFRFWRDAGYAIGAILTGLTADWLGVNFSIILIGLLTIASAVVVLYRMHCTDNHSLKIWEWITGRKLRADPSCSNKMPAVSLAT